ncbi:MAG TPA: hypothetical protein VD794_03445, partial [Flavisolibacter sp.]|nr:hypothetical protein [Flavisolibacter sp.]
MLRYGLLLLILAFTACSNEKKNTAPEVEEDNSVFNYEAFSTLFKETSLPYQLTDSGLLDNEDTVSIRNEVFASYINDSLKTKLVGKTSKVKYLPLAHLKQGNKEQYFVIKAMGGNKSSALLAVFDKDKNFVNAFPF